MLKSNPPCDSIGDKAFGRSLDQEVGALMMRLVPLEKMGESLLLSLLSGPCEDPHYKVLSTS